MVWTNNKSHTILESYSNLFFGKKNDLIILILVSIIDWVRCNALAILK